VAYVHNVCWWLLLLLLALLQLNVCSETTVGKQSISWMPPGVQ
jgi:hypothetical protein